MDARFTDAFAARAVTALLPIVIALALALARADALARRAVATHRALSRRAPLARPRESRRRRARGVARRAVPVASHRDRGRRRDSRAMPAAAPRGEDDSATFDVRVLGDGARGDGVVARVDVSARGLRIDRLIDDDDGARGRAGARTRRAMLGKFPLSSVARARTRGADVELGVVVVGETKAMRLRARDAREAEALVEAMCARGGEGLRARLDRDARMTPTASTSGSSSALVRDLREENLLLSDALREAEAELEAARAREGAAKSGRTTEEGYFDNSTVSYEIKVRNLTKNLEFQQERAAQLRSDYDEQRLKLERYRSLEEVMGRENEALRKDLQIASEERDKAMRRAETSEIMAAHAKNEVSALGSGEVSESALVQENLELRREIAVINSAKSTADEHLRLTLAHLRAARDENVRLTETLLKKTEESFAKEARNAELEQMIDGVTLREHTSSKELAIALQERTDAINRAKIFEKDVKRLSGEVERLVAKIGDAERAAAREKEEIRFECAEQVQDHAMQVSKHTASARDAAVEAQKQATIANSALMAKQELEFELHEERRRRIDLERQIAQIEAAKQTIADFTADAEASVLRSIQAQREANVEVQRLRIEKHDLRGRLAATPSPSSADEAWRTQLGATIDFHRTLRGSPTSTPTTQTRASWSRVTDLGSGAAFASKATPSSAQQRLDEIKSEIALIKRRQTPVKTSLETKFNLENGPRVSTAPRDVYDDDRVADSTP